MNIEYEATFKDVDKNNIKNRLKNEGAQLIKEEFLQKRTVFGFPGEDGYSPRWLRVRDEDDKITLSLKIVDGDRIEDQKEICLQVDNYDEAVNLLEEMGYENKAYQETKREKWLLNGVEICIDEWPFLEPFVEIEGSNEKEVKIISEKLGFDYSQAFFGSADGLYEEKYKVSKEIINNKIKKIIFEGENPFL